VGYICWKPIINNHYYHATHVHIMYQTHVSLTVLYSMFLHIFQPSCGIVIVNCNSDEDHAHSTTIGIDSEVNIRTFSS
jgi:hypothetical protein